MLFRKGNTKLGKNVWVWSLPAVKTCPGSSVACRSVCYALDNWFQMPSHLKLYENNRRLTKRKSFVQLAVEEIHKRKIRLLRIHVAGDFYDAEYVDKWREIAKRCPQTQFYAYTRSWTLAEIRPALLQLSRLSNLQLWFSFDKDMPVPRKAAGVKSCYMSLNDGDWPPVGSSPDLVFRVQYKKTVVKADPNTQATVCPVENGVTKTSCDRCQLCFLSRMNFRQQLPVLQGGAA